MTACVVVCEAKMCDRSIFMLLIYKYDTNPEKAQYENCIETTCIER